MILIMYVEPSLHHKSSGKCRLKQQGDIITHLAEQTKSRALTTLDAGEHEPQELTLLAEMHTVQAHWRTV